MQLSNSEQMLSIYYLFQLILGTQGVCISNIFTTKIVSAKARDESLGSKSLVEYLLEIPLEVHLRKILTWFYVFLFQWGKGSSMLWKYMVLQSY